MIDARKTNLDDLMRDLTIIGFVALFLWACGAVAAVISGYSPISAQDTLRFLLAVLIVSFARRTYWEVRQWRWSKLPPDERSGFTNPLEPVRSAPIEEASATGPSQAAA